MLNKILEKPESYRRKVAAGTTLIVGIFIFSIWAMLAHYNLQQTIRTEKPKSSKKQAEEFRENLPSLTQNKTVMTELAKQKAAGKVSLDKSIKKEERSFWDLLFGW